MKEYVCCACNQPVMQPHQPQYCKLFIPEGAKTTPDSCPFGFMNGRPSGIRWSIWAGDTKETGDNFIDGSGEMIKDET